MNKIIIFIFVIFIIIAGGLILLYFYFEKPAEDNIKNNIVDLSIFAKESNNNIETNYTIYKDETFYSEGITLLNGAVYDSVFINNSIEICNKNINNQEYYIECKQLSLYGGKLPPQRIELNLHKRQNLTITYEKQYLNLKLMLFSEYQKNLYLCFKYSAHLLNANLVNFQETKLTNYSYYDKCYDLKTNLINETKTFNIEYKIWGNLDLSDYIDILIIDNNCENNKCIPFKETKDYINLN